MSNKKTVITFIIIITFIAGWLALPKGQLLPFNKPIPTPTSQQEALRLVSTNPDPLEGATILPTQSLEFTFNKPIAKTEFKHLFDPEVEHEVEIASNKKGWLGNTIKLNFKKPLQLGSGYTLFIYQNTQTEDKQTLDKEYVFHFSTIKYRGI